LIILFLLHAYEYVNKYHNIIYSLILSIQNYLIYSQFWQNT